MDDEIIDMTGDMESINTLPVVQRGNYVEEAVQNAEKYLSLQSNTVYILHHIQLWISKSLLLYKASI